MDKPRICRVYRPANGRGYDTDDLFIVFSPSSASISVRMHVILFVRCFATTSDPPCGKKDLPVRVPTGGGATMPATGESSTFKNLYTGPRTKSIST